MFVVGVLWGATARKECSVSDFTNLAQAVGSSDTIAIRTKIEKLYEKAKK